jgi:C1A family cysteine protease
VNQDKLSLENLRNEIKEKDANWKAARTSISELIYEERINRLGLLPSNEQLQQISKLGIDTERASRSFEKNEPMKGTPIENTESIDWRAFNGANWTTPIKDQGNCGSCVAFGTIATLEELLKIHCYKDATKDIDLSEAHLLWCGGGSCNGWQMDKACEYLKKNGVPDESCFPYQDKPMSCKNTCPDWKGQVGNTIISDWSNTKDIATMKDRLIENGPQISGMAVYNDFFSYKSGVYKHVTGNLAGYHCVNVVGFNDNEGCWICKNSWGTGWGESGFFKIAYGECGIEDAFGMWDMTVKPVEIVEEGYADEISIDYSFASSTQVLHAYANGKWRHKQLKDADSTGIAALAIAAGKVYVGWKDDQLTFIRCYK